MPQPSPVNVLRRPLPTPPPRGRRPVPAALFDMDGTLADVSSIRHHVRLDDPRNTGVRRFDRFHDESVDVPANQQALDEHARALRDGLAIIVVTAREERWSWHTMLWLRDHGIAYDELHMRPAGDYRADRDVKADVLAAIRRRGYQPVRAIDDNPSIIALWNDEAIDVVRIPGWQWEQA